MQKIMDKPGYLQGQLLVATPAVTESCFERSVVYICSHDSSGAVGILVNHVLEDLTCSDILEQLSIKNLTINNNSPVHFGGPVESSRGFILHTKDYSTTDTMAFNGNVALTSNVDIIKDIASGKGPSKSIVALGYSGWDKGQLEGEILNNSWINVPANENLLFNLDNKYKWVEAAKSLGVDLFKYSGDAGHA